MFSRCFYIESPLSRDIFCRSVETLVTFSSNYSDFEKNPKTQQKNPEKKIKKIHKTRKRL